MTSRDDLSSEDREKNKLARGLKSAMDTMRAYRAESNPVARESLRQKAKKFMQDTGWDSGSIKMMCGGGL